MGKRRSGRTRKGSPWLRGALVEAAHAAGRTQTYLGAQFHRVAAHRGAKRAAVAVGHTILVVAYHLLAGTATAYRELGHDFYDRRDRQRVTRRLVRRMEVLGYQVALSPVGA